MATSVNSKGLLGSPLVIRLRKKKDEIVVTDWTSFNIQGGALIVMVNQVPVIACAQGEWLSVNCVTG